MYREKDMLVILEQMGVKDKPDWTQEDGDIAGIQMIGCFDEE